MPFKRATRDMFVYKRIFSKHTKYLVTMVIPEGTQYYYEKAKGKHRAELAVVLSIMPLQRKLLQEKNWKPVWLPLYPIESEVHHYFNHWARSTKYKAGEVVYPDSFSLRHDECTHGIHFFKDWEQACDY